MLDDSLTPEERAVVERAKSFAADHVAPNAARWEWERHYPLETIKLACSAGLNTIELAKQHGGQGLTFSCKLRAFEEIAKADFAFAFALINHHNAVTRFARDGQPAQVARLLPRMIAGEVIGRCQGCHGRTGWVVVASTSIRSSCSTQYCSVTRSKSPRPVVIGWDRPASVSCTRYRRKLSSAPPVPSLPSRAGWQANWPPVSWR